METIFDDNAENHIHHVYCIETVTQADQSLRVAELISLLEKRFGIVARGNPDVWHGIFETFGIDESRALKEMQMKRAVGNDQSAGKKIFIIETNFFTREAQNSLLKVFEEPTENTHFFVFTSSFETLLPTLRSRMVMVRKKNEKIAADGDAFVESFFAASKAQRLALVAGLIEEKDKMAVLNFLDQLERRIYLKSLAKNPSRNLLKNLSREEVDFFHDFYKCKGYLTDRSASVKMILEHVALTAPLC